MGYLVELLPALKILMMIILFPLVGAVVAAIVWVHTHKRRKEIWTYLCLGWKDRKVISIITYELVFDALSGIALGLFLGYLSKIVVEKSNIWLEFGYTLPFLCANLGLVIFSDYSLYLYQPAGLCGLYKKSDCQQTFSY